ncbi:MAG: hypothetical protein WCK70_20010, partial [Chloroflexales bacterium]
MNWGRLYKAAPRALCYALPACWRRAEPHTWRWQMSLDAPLAYIIPDETARVAHAAFPKGNA